MKKTMIFLSAVFFMVAMALSANAGQKINCTVQAVQGKSVIFNCGESTSKMKMGDQVRLSLNTKKKAGNILEGC